MGIQKTRAVILSMLPYRESSAIVTLYTNEYGRVNGIAKGVRKRSKNSLPLERGFLIDLILYIKQGRDLHTLADINICDYYPEIRGDLYKTAIRDAAFELLLKSVMASEPHPELFSLLQQFLISLQSTDATENFALLWKFYLKTAGFLGFAVRLDSCRCCGREILISEGGFLAMESGGLYCSKCGVNRSLSGTYIQGTVLQKLNGSSLPLKMPTNELIRLSRLTAAYCRFHLDIRTEFKSLNFIEQIAG
jgi:DNA repair protein RecO (recombination protein O)